MDGGETLPRGQYRAVLVNKGGERSERSFTFDAPEVSRYPFPELAIANGLYRVDSRYPVNRLICYNQEGNPVQTIGVDNFVGSVADLRLSGSVRSAALWAEDPEYRCSALTAAAPTR
jgi:hypothetical protein